MDTLTLVYINANGGVPLNSLAVYNDCCPLVVLWTGGWNWWWRPLECTWPALLRQKSIRRLWWRQFPRMYITSCYWLTGALSVWLQFHMGCITWRTCCRVQHKAEPRFVAHWPHCSGWWHCTNLALQLMCFVQQTDDEQFSSVSGEFCVAYVKEASCYYHY